MLKLIVKTCFGEIRKMDLEMFSMNMFPDLSALQWLWKIKIIRCISRRIQEVPVKLTGEHLLWSKKILETLGSGNSQGRFIFPLSKQMFLKTFIIYREFPTRIAAAAVFSRCVLNQGNPHFNRVIFYLHDENGLVFSKVLRCLTEQY